MRISFYGSIAAPACLLAVCLVALAAPAKAQNSDQQYAWCANEGAGYAPDLRISGCTAIIQAGRENTQALAVAYFNRGRAFAVRWSSSNIIRAIADYDEAIRLNPQFAMAYLARGDAHTVQNIPVIAPDLVRAIVDYDEAIRLSPRLVKAYLSRGAAYHHQDDDVRAIADFDEAIRLSPDDKIAYARRAKFYIDRGDFHRAAMDHRKLHQLEPGEPAYLNALCFSMARAGEDLAQAQAACDASLRIRPNDEGALGFRGFVGLKRGRFQQAWNDYDAAVRINPEASYLYGRGVAALRLGRTSEGQADIARATTLDAKIAQKQAGWGVTP